MDESSKTSPAPERVAPIPVSRLFLHGLVLLVVPALLTVILGGHLPEVEVYAHEQVLLPVLLVARILWSFLRGLRLLPLLDLPLLGLVFVFTGAGQSPLDPALFLIYALLAFYLERSPRPRLSGRYYGLFLGGFAGMYGIVLLHVFLDQNQVLEVETTRLEQRALNIKRPLEDQLFERSDTDYSFHDLRQRIDQARAKDPVVRAQWYFAPSENPARTERNFDDFYEVHVAALEERARLLREAALTVTVETPWEEADECRLRLTQGFAETDERMDEVVGDLATALAILNEAIFDPNEASYGPDADGKVPDLEWHDTLLGLDPYKTLEETRLVQQRICDQFEVYFGELRELAIMRYDLGSNLKEMLSHRLAILIMVLATLSIVAGLRFNFEAEVKRREAARAALEVGAKDREKENWIALTAGLTHTIGNDILAYDAYGEEAIDAIREHAGPLPPVIERNLRFIYESNKARLGFIKFLDEFARARKHAADAVPPRPAGLTTIAIESLLNTARAQVGEIEVADLPRDSQDPQVRAERRKFVELPMEVVFAGETAGDRSVTSGKRGILQFFCYELIKNALRNCSGNLPLRVEVAKPNARVRMRFINDLAVQTVETDDGRVRYRLPRISSMRPCDDDELRQQVEEILDHCFEPGRGGGTGLGLFLIRYFVREYYRGSVTAHIHDWDRRLVVFDLDLPDDLEHMAEESTGDQTARPVL